MTLRAFSKSALSTVKEMSVAGAPAPWLTFCTIMSTLMAASPSALKMRAATPGLSGTADEGDFGLVFVERDAADDDVFHACGFFFHNGSWVVIETGADFEHDAEFFGELDRARLHHLRAKAGQFEHFVVGNFLELARARHDARVGGVNAIDVRVNLAKVGLERRGQGDGRQVRTAAAQRGDLPFGSLSLKTGDDDHVALIEQLMDLLGGDVLNLGLGVNAIGDDARLRAGQRHGRDIQGMQRHGRERDGGLLAGGQEHVHLALAGQRHDFLGQLDEIVGHAAHGGNDHDDLVALLRYLATREATFLMRSGLPTEVPPYSERSKT